MREAIRGVAVTAAVLLSGSMYVARAQTARGPAPRPAEKPPEYGCTFRDLVTVPNVVREGDRIDAFRVTYRCPGKTRPVDIEIRNELVPGAELELVKVSTDLVLEKGEHTIVLGGGGVAHGGRYITVLKADAPAGKKEVTRHVDPAVCRGWRLEYSEKHLKLGGEAAAFRADPEVFKPGERIDKFVLTTDLKHPVKKVDIKVSWQPRTGANPDARRELVKVATEATLPAGKNTMNLLGGGVGREGHYILEIPGVTSGSYFKTVCNGWTLSNR